MRDQKGITLVTLMLTMIIIFIIGAISVYTGVDAYRTIRIQNFTAQMRVVQERVNLICEDWRNWDGYDSSLTGLDADNNFNTYISEYLKEMNGGVEVKKANEIANGADFQEIIDKQENLSGPDTILSNYYYFSKEDLEKYLSLRNLDIEVIINFYTGTFFEKEGVEALNTAGEMQTYYTLEDLVEAQRLTETIIQNIVKDEELSEYYKKLNVGIEENDGISQTIGIYLNSRVEFPIKKIEKVTEYYDNIEDNSIVWEVVAEGSYETSGGFISIKIEESGLYNFKVTDNVGNVFYSKESIDVELVNKPVLTEGMTPIIFEDGEILQTSEDDPKWYNYSSDKRQWANVMLEDGSIYVWIPRFSYNINSDETISICFLEAGTDIPISEAGDVNNKVVHPAFVGSTSYTNGEWNNAVNGIWVAKFIANISGDEQKITTTYGKEMTKVKDFYTALTICRQMQEKDYYGLKVSAGIDEQLEDSGAISYDTHLIKNSEMGALLYLTYSSYGRDRSKISNNETRISGGNETEYSVFSNGDYSTTGNAYGVYDLIKPDGEYVAAVFSEIGKIEEIILQIMRC